MLHDSARDGNLQDIEKQIKKGAEIDEFHLGWTPLMRAAENGKREAARLLVRRGAKLNIQIRYNQDTALHFAVFFGHFEVVRDLAEAGANLFLKNREGNTAFILAKKRGNHEIAKFLENLMTNPKPNSEILDEMKTQIEGEMESLRSAVQQQFCKIDHLEAATLQQNLYIVRLQNNVEQLQKDLDCQTRANLELAKLIVGEPSNEALKILNNAFKKSPINVDFSVTSSSAKKDRELLEAAKFVKEMKRNKKELTKLLAERQRMRDQLDTQLFEAIKTFSVNKEELKNSIVNYEIKIGHLKPETNELQISVDENIRRIKENGKTEKVFCKLHRNIKDFTSSTCHHRVCIRCVEEKKRCGECGSKILGKIKQIN